MEREKRKKADPMRTFKHRLREERKKLGYSQQELADKLGYVQSMICRWEKGILVHPNYERILETISKLEPKTKE